MSETFSLTEWRMHKILAFLRRRLHLLALLSLAGVIIGQLGGLHWLAELFSHFLPYYAAVFALAALWPQRRWRAVWLGCAAASLLWLAQPFALPSAGQGGSRLVWYNVHLDNPAAAEEGAALLAEGADILALGEINLDDMGWQALREAYPHGCERREHSPFALALWSRAPLAACEVRMLGDYPYIRAQTADGTAVYALHPPPPISSELAAARQAYLAETAAAIAAEPRALAVGDFNSSPFSPLFRRFVHTSGAQPATRYFTPTWQPFFLNIDHVLAKNLAAAVRPLPWRHSDHRALRVEYR